MSPSDFLYQQTFKQFMAMGYSDRDAGYVAADAVGRWKRQGGHPRLFRMRLRKARKRTGSV